MASHASIARHAQRLKQSSLRELLGNTSRGDRLRKRMGPLLLDLSRQKLDVAALDALGEWLQDSGWEAARDAMFAGAAINRSEQRAVLHTALRSAASALEPLAPSAVREEIAQVLARMDALVAALSAGRGASVGLADGITDVINIGIGGSDLGPRLAERALSPFHTRGLKLHFLTNVDGQSAYELMHSLDPKKTLVILASKSFITQETLLNGHVLRDWIVAAQGGDSAAIARHFVAVSANTQAAVEWGIPASHIYPMWDFVGGRFSVWSAVGLSLALAVGMSQFCGFLAGAAQLDDHFRRAPWQENLPVLLALIEYWNRNIQKHGSRAVVPYADLLADLPFYLQQLEMESLGKRVSINGEELWIDTVPVVWGSVGTSAQHAYFQALHQGTTVVPLEFVGSIRPAHPLKDNHEALLANLLAQASALALGKNFDEALAESSGNRELAAQRVFPGDRPSTVILLDALTPESLGALIALHEHKVFLLAHLWGINAFDQWGVELGKLIAKRILPALSHVDADVSTLDASTRALLDEIHAHR